MVDTGAKMPLPVPVTAVVNWYRYGIAAFPVVLRRVAGAVTVTVSPGKKLT
ncbi:hypothetical protein GCM10011383_32020 [Hymenobacter cavernae]|uniref:Uncharacterized protein n=1 Tax=Hymenobacter cavernae TaxID=2044852 RepID=A0ABQ1UHF3_9BACT|nr:hypothetical protein GCM10011383_32020 [Hymenobacter cavernae]